MAYKLTCAELRAPGRLLVAQFESTPKAFANFSPGFELARTLGTNKSMFETL